MKIIIAGGTGFIGQALVQHFNTKGYQCVIIGRNLEKITALFDAKVKPLTWQQMAMQGLHEIKTADAIINLAGANIGAKRWTPSRKDELIASRVIPTETLAKLCAQLGENSPPFFSADGIGIYGLQPATASGLPPPITEQQAINFDNPATFLERIGLEWEYTTEAAKVAGVRVINMRFGVVLGKNGGVLEKLKLPFLFFMGGPIGNGKQPFSWISLTDLVAAIDFLIAHPDISGPVNIVAPQTVTQAEFATALGKALQRPALLPTPAFILGTLFGQMARELLLNGQHVVPTVLEKQGFKFTYPDINRALEAALK